MIPVGGLGHGHKGHALTVMIELLSQALAGYGRAQSTGSSEQNSVFLQVIDPTALGSRSDYDLEAEHLVAMIEASPADDPDHPVRVPGFRAWRERVRQIDSGVVLEPGIIEGLEPFAREAGLGMPLGEPG